MKPAAGQFAQGHDIATMHSRPSVRRGVFDLIKVSRVEMLHRCLRLSVAIERVLPGSRGRADSTFCCVAQFYAAMHKTQAGVSALPIVPAPPDALGFLHRSLHFGRLALPQRLTAQANANKSKQNCFHLLSFIFRNRAFSMGYDDSK